MTGNVTARREVAELIGVSLILALGCGTANPSPAPAGGDVITREELAQTGLANAIDVIRRVRPRWLARLDRRECVIPYRDQQRMIRLQAEWADLDVRVADLSAIRYFAPGGRTPTGIAATSDCAYIQFVTATRGGP